MELPPNEAERLGTLVNYGILDTEFEESFDRIVRIAATVFDVPVALVSLIDTNRQWSKAMIGTDARETAREISFCTHAILDTDVLMVPDASRDERFAANPLVTGKPGIRFYAGAPLILLDGTCIGTLSLLDTRPRWFAASDIQLLEDLRDLAVSEIERDRMTTLTGTQSAGN